MKIPERWNKENYITFQKELSLIADNAYREFNEKIISTHYPMLGIRVPELKKIAIKIAKKDCISFLQIVDHTYYEEVLLEGLVITKIKDIEMLLFYFERYLPKIDNWALCDCVISQLKIVLSYKELFYQRILDYVKDKREYTVRVGFILLLYYYVDFETIDDIFTLILANRCDTYYVQMAIAWLICECFIKEREKTLGFLKKKQLPKFVHNKAISKIRDSYRVCEEDKYLVGTLRK